MPAATGIDGKPLPVEGKAEVPGTAVGAPPASAPAFVVRPSENGSMGGLTVDREEGAESDKADRAATDCVERGTAATGNASGATAGSAAADAGMTGNVPEATVSWPTGRNGLASVTSGSVRGRLSKRRTGGVDDRADLAVVAANDRSV